MKKIKEYTLKFFEKKFKQEKDAKVKLRIQILLYLREGYTQREVSQMLRLSVGIVPFWKKRFEEEGLAGLEDKAGRGIKPKLTEEQLSILASEIEVGVLMDDGYRRGFKTKDVTEFISTQFGIKYKARHTRRIIKWITGSLIVPRPRHKKRNKEDIKNFKKEFKKNEKVWVIT